jgi:hypothetical protein
MTDVRNDIAAIWKVLDTWSDTLDLDNEMERRAWDDVCESMERIAEQLGYDSADIWLELNN